jgi:hypothetical protein
MKKRRRHQRNLGGRKLVEQGTRCMPKSYQAPAPSIFPDSPIPRLDRRLAKPLYSSTLWTSQERWLFLLLFAVLGFELRASYLLARHSTWVFCVLGILEMEISRTIYPGWLWTAIFLIFVSWVAGITGMSCNPCLGFVCFCLKQRLAMYPRLALTSSRSQDSRVLGLQACVTTLCVS